MGRITPSRPRRAPHPDVHQKCNKCWAILQAGWVTPNEVRKVCEGANMAEEPIPCKYCSAPATSVSLCNACAELTSEQQAQTVRAKFACVADDCTNIWSGPLLYAPQACPLCRNPGGKAIEITLGHDRLWPVDILHDEVRFTDSDRYLYIISFRHSQIYWYDEQTRWFQWMHDQALSNSLLILYSGIGLVALTVVENDQHVEGTPPPVANNATPIAEQPIVEQPEPRTTKTGLAARDSIREDIEAAYDLYLNHEYDLTTAAARYELEREALHAYANGLTYQDYSQPQKKTARARPILALTPFIVLWLFVCTKSMITPAAFDLWFFLNGLLPGAIAFSYFRYRDK